MIQIYRKLPLAVCGITAVALALFGCLAAQTAFAGEEGNETVDLNDCELLINGQEWTVFGVDAADPSNGISQDDLNIELKKDGEIVPGDQYNVAVEQCYWDEDAEVTEPAAAPYGVLKNSDKNGKDGFTSYAVTASPADDSPFVGQKRAEFIVCDKYCLNYVGGDNIGFEGKYRSGEQYWNRMYSAGYYRLPAGTGEEALQMVDITDALIPEGSCNVTYFKRASGEAIEDIVTDFTMERQDYIDAIWPETAESRLDRFPTEPGTYFVKIEAKETSGYYGTMIVDFDILGPFTAQMYADASDGHRYRGEDDEVLSIDPGQKIFIVFRTGYEENLEHGLAPLVGFHDGIEQDGKIIGDLSNVGFKVATGSVKDLGYTGKIEDAVDEDHGLEIDAANLEPGTTGTLHYCLYPYEGDDFWRDFENGTFSFGDEPAAGYAKELKVVVSEHQWSSGELTKATTQKDGMITKHCERCGKTEVLQTISHPAKYAFAPTKYVYNGRARTPALTVTDSKDSVINTSNYSVTYVNNVKAGTAKATITFRGNYSGSITKNFTIAKATNPITAKGKTAIVKVKAVRKKAQVLAKAKVLTVSKNQGKVTFTKVSGSKNLTIAKTTGKITVKKKTKKGTYKIKVKVTAAGNANYKTAARTATVTVKVK